MATHHGERMIEGNGIDICTDSFGDPSDPCILLIMGAGASMLLWEVDFCQRLADGGRFVIRYDNRDTGKTTSCPPGEPNYTVADMADDGIAVLDAYDVERAHIIGASMGGTITQLIGLNHRQRALTLTPIMSTPNVNTVIDAMAGEDGGSTLSPPTPEVLAAIAAGAELDFSDRGAVLANRIEMGKVIAGSGYPQDDIPEEVYAAEIDRAISFPSSLNHGAVIVQSEPWHDRLDQLDIPTLVIHGDEDPILPYDHGQALHAAISGSTMLTLPGVGHELPRGTWDTVIPAILDHTN